MIEEAYVSFEAAKLLKEKGFDTPLFTYYVSKERDKGYFQIMEYTDDKIYNSHSEYCYLAPTQQMAMRWLREVYNISIEISSFWNGSNDDPYKFSKYTYGFRVDTPNFTDRYRKSEFDTYEEAAETAIKHCLKNLI